MIRKFVTGDERALYCLWETEGPRFGYAALTESKFREIFLEHPDFSAEFTFVVEEDGHICGFVNGCAGAPDTETGYISCLLLESQVDTVDNTTQLVCALEDEFRKAGKKYCAVSFFNPIRLPWVIPGTPGHQHNNLPGVPVDVPLYHRLLTFGYEETSRECGLYCDLADYTTPEWVEDKAAQMAQRGYTVAMYDRRCHQGLDEMVHSLGNPQWSAEIPAACGTRIAIRRVARALFVGGDDVTDPVAVFVQAVINVEHCSARVSENGIRTLLQQAFNYNI